MTKRAKWLGGKILKIVSLVGGSYLIIIAFGIEPLKTISMIWQTHNGWAALEKTLLQIFKIFFGGGYSFLGMIVLYRCGTHLATKVKE